MLKLPEMGVIVHEQAVAQRRAMNSEDERR
jgi:hypothetical protein